MTRKKAPISSPATMAKSQSLPNASQTSAGLCVWLAKNQHISPESPMAPATNHATLKSLCSRLTPA